MANVTNMLKRTSLALKIGLSVSLLILLATTVDVQTTKDALLAAEPIWFTAVFGIYLIQVLCATARWCFVLQSLQQKISFLMALRLTMVGQFFNQCLPSNIGGDAMRMFYLHRAGMEAGPAINSVLLDRIIGLIVLVLMCTVSLPFLASKIDNRLTLGALASLIGICWIAVLVLIFLKNPLTLRFQTYKLIGFLIGLSQKVRALLFSRTAAIGTLSASILIHLCSISIAWSIDKALGGDASYMVFFVSILPTLLVVSIPISIAGWGVREQTLVIILGGLGIASEHAFGVSILFGTALVIGSIPGAVFWLKSNRPAGQT
jgi:glycosyltransferase 2 family protein